MVRAIGIDPGTKSFDFCGLDDEKIILDISISTKDIIKDPELISNIIQETKADFVVGPSGFGIPITDIKDVGERELFLMSLIKKDDKKSLLGLRTSIKRMQYNKLPVFFIPGVIHLSTIPSYRKLNKIDMGTADKLCCTALGIRDQALKFNIGYNEVSFILLEMGFGYTAAVAVKNGHVEELKIRLYIAPIRMNEGLGTKTVKEAAQGAAIIANGIASGNYSQLIGTMQIKEAKGTSLDYILLPEIENIKKDYNCLLYTSDAADDLLCV